MRERATQLFLESAVLLFVSRVLGCFKSNVANIAMGETKFQNLATKFLSVVLWNIRNLKDTLIQHSIIQSNRTVLDRSILSGMKKNDLIYVSPAYQLEHSQKGAQEKARE